MNARLRSIAVLLVAGSAAGCAASGAPAGAPEPADEPAPAAPRAGTNFLVVYATPTGVHLQDTRTGADSLLVPGVALSDAPVVAPDGSGSAFRVTWGDSMAMMAVRRDAPGAVTVHRGLAAGRFTAAWSGDGRLGVGYRAPDGGSHAVVALGADGTVRNLGCSASHAFLAWQGGDAAVVGDARNVYTVRASNCATLTTLPRQGKSDFAFSPDGRRLSFVTGGARGGMFIARVNGAGATQVADAMFNPRNARWAPHGTQVAFEIRSRQYANVTHVAIHDVPTGEISFADRQTELGLPSDAHPCWSPDGSALLHERRYARSGAAQAYTMRQLVVKAVATSEERIISEELISAATPAFAPSCWWSDGRHVVVRTLDSFDVIDVFSSETYEIPARRQPLLVRAFPPSDPSR